MHRFGILSRIYVSQRRSINLNVYECKRNYKKDFNKELITRFENTHKFCNGGINKFILWLRKGVDPYEYIDSR